jgi:hypothetical protein
VYVGEVLARIPLVSGLRLGLGLGFIFGFVIEFRLVLDLRIEVIELGLGLDGSTGCHRRCGPLPTARRIVHVRLGRLTSPVAFPGPPPNHLHNALPPRLLLLTLALPFLLAPLTLTQAFPLLIALSLALLLLPELFALAVQLGLALRCDPALHLRQLGSVRDLVRVRVGEEVPRTPVYREELVDARHDSHAHAVLHVLGGVVAQTQAATPILAVQVLYHCAWVLGAHGHFLHLAVQEEHVVLTPLELACQADVL